MTGIRIGLVATTWRVNVYEGEPARPAECMDAISAVVYRLRGLYDLSSDG